MNATPQEKRYASFRASLGDLRVPEVQITTLRYERKQSDVQKRTMERARKWRSKDQR